MSGTGSRHYLFGVLFIALGIYYIVTRDYLEFSLYGCAGLAFIVNALAMDDRAARYKKNLTILSWVLIAASGILFLYLLQFKYL